MEAKRDVNLLISLGYIIGLIGDPDRNKILQMLVNGESLNSKKLLQGSRIPKTRFYPAIRELVKYNLILRRVEQNGDRNVEYSLSPLAKGLNVPSILDKVKEAPTQDIEKIKGVLSTITQTTPTGPIIH